MTWNGAQGFQTPIEPETFSVNNFGVFGNTHSERGLTCEFLAHVFDAIATLTPFASRLDVEFYFSGHMTPRTFTRQIYGFLVERADPLCRIRSMGCVQYHFLPAGKTGVGVDLILNGKKCFFCEADVRHYGSFSGSVMMKCKLCIGNIAPIVNALDCTQGQTTRRFERVVRLCRFFYLFPPCQCPQHQKYNTTDSIFSFSTI